MTGRTSIEALLIEGQRQITICNACRYCEGYCAVFPAMERLKVIGAGDLTYLANLCHDCRACYQACMYTPPHPFAVEIPTVMSEARELSYEQFGRPRWLARSFTAGPWAIAVLTAIGTLVFALLAWAAGQAGEIVNPSNSDRTFFDVIPYSLMVVPSLLLTAFVVAAITWGFVDFHRDSRGAERLSRSAWARGLLEVATLRWMKGGGDECYYPTTERPSPLRRRLHHLTAYGFMLAFASTTLAAIYHHIIGEKSPYPVIHPVVLLGLAGGIGMTVGTSGLLWLRVRAASLQARREAILNSSFLISLNAASTSGLLLLLLRDTPLMGALLLLHLGTIFALYVTAPYGKFVHIVYRTAAVLRSAAERAADEATQLEHPSVTAARAGARPEESTPAEAAQVGTGAR